MTVVISLFNLSGGVGKSTLTKEVGYGLAQAGQRVLLVDLDPQASLTAFLGMEPEADPQNLPKIAIDRPTLYQCIKDDCDRSPIVRAKTETFDWGLDLIPTGLELALAEAELVIADMKEVRLRRLLAKYVNDYDYILIDCQPSMGILPYIALAASTHVIIPVQTEFKCVNGTNLVFAMLTRVRQGANKGLQIAAFVPTLYDHRQKHHQETLAFIESPALKGVAPIMPPVGKIAIATRSTYERKPIKALGPRFSEAEHRALAAIDTLTSHILTLN